MASKGGSARARCAHAQRPVGAQRARADGRGEGIVFVAAHYVIGGGENKALDGRAVRCGQRHIEGDVDGDGRIIPTGVRVGVAGGEVNDRLHSIQRIPPAVVAGIGQVTFDQFDRRGRAGPVLSGGGLQRLQLLRRRCTHVQPDQQRAGTGAGQLQQQLCTQIAKPARNSNGTRGRHMALFSCRRTVRSITLFRSIESKGGPVNTRSTDPPY